MNRHIQQIWQGFLDLLFPPRLRCALCGRFLHAEKGLVCEACQFVASHPPGMLCPRCGRSLAAQRFAANEDVICPYCNGESWAFSQARSIGPYDGDLRMAIHRLKFRGQQQLSKALAELMFQAIESAWWSEVDCLVPVPLHPERIKQRGFNQSERLAYELSLLAGLPMRLLLERIIPTKSQTGLTRQLRRLNVHGAFRVTPEIGSSVVGRCILLVDDVMTTGSTLSACAEALLKAGAKEVRVVTAAVTNIRQ